MSIYPLCYTYLIGWSHLNIYYYGCQYSKKCHPSKLFVKYFTSSKYVKRYLEEHGTPDIIEVRKTFKTKEETLMYEHKVLRRLDAKHREDFLNKNNGRDWDQSPNGRFWIRNHPDKDLATEVKYLKVGEPIPDGWFKGFLASSENQKEVAKNLWLGRSHKPETIMKMRENNLGEKNPNFGRIYSEEEKQKLSDARKGEKNHFHGKSHNEESKRRMGESKKSKLSVLIDDIEYYSIHEASRKTGIDRRSIKRRCKNDKIANYSFI